MNGKLQIRESTKGRDAMKHTMPWGVAAAILAMAVGGAAPAEAAEGIIIPHEKITLPPGAAPSAQKKFKGGSEAKPGVVVHDFNFTHTLDKAALPTRPRRLDKAGNSTARRRK
jgi:hypothetical protein